MSHHVVSLEVPASPEYAQVVRMAGASVVGLYDVTYDVVDDIRMLVDEAFILLLGTGLRSKSLISFSFSVLDGTLHLIASSPDSTLACDKSEHSFGFGIVEALSDTCEVDDSADHCVITMTYRLTRA